MLRLPTKTHLVINIVLILLAGLACQLPTRSAFFPEDPTVEAPPTRTPYPTFTPTVITELAIATALPTDTPLTTLPTNTPETAAAAVSPVDTPAAEAVSPTDTPEPTAVPTEPPPPPPPPPPPTEPPPPPAPAFGPNGVKAKIDFRDGRNTYKVGERVFVRIEAVTEAGAGQKPFGVLGLNTSEGTFQTSWSNASIDGTFTHEDGIAFATPGNHKIWLSICFSSIDVCQGADGNWERFEPGLDVIIQ